MLMRMLMWWWFVLSFGSSLTGEIIFLRTSHFVIGICTRAGCIWGFCSELPYQDSFAGEVISMKWRKREDRVNGKNVNDRPNLHCTLCTVHCTLIRRHVVCSVEKAGPPERLSSQLPVEEEVHAGTTSTHPLHLYLFYWWKIQDSNTDTLERDNI